MFKDGKTAMLGTLVLALFLSLVILTNPGKALAVDAFLKIDGIKGESRNDKHKDEIDVISWSFGETNSGTVHAGGGGGGGKVNMQDFKFTMRTNMASPKLFLACASGQHIKDAKLAVRKTGKDQVDFFEIWLTEVLVSSFVSLGSSTGTDAYPMEEIMLNFAKIKITYKPIKADGSLGVSEVVGWDVKANKRD